MRKVFYLRSFSATHFISKTLGLGELECSKAEILGKSWFSHFRFNTISLDLQTVNKQIFILIYTLQNSYNVFRHSARTAPQSSIK